MADYKVFWVQDNILSMNGIMQEVPNAQQVINQWCEAGYELLSVVPGTNAQTYSGLYITLKK